MTYPIPRIINTLLKLDSESRFKSLSRRVSSSIHWRGFGTNLLPQMVNKPASWNCRILFPKIKKKHWCLIWYLQFYEMRLRLTQCWCARCKDFAFAKKWIRRYSMQCLSTSSNDKSPFFLDLPPWWILKVELAARTIFCYNNTLMLLTRKSNVSNLLLCNRDFLHLELVSDSHPLFCIASVDPFLSYRPTFYSHPNKRNWRLSPS